MMPNGLRLALGFLTTLPVSAGEYDAREFSRSARYFPWVGLLLGLLLSAAYLALDLILPPLLVSVLVTILWAGLTGGLHLDGLADCCDGLLAPVPPQRRLEIMRDPCVGAFGAIGLILFLLLKVAALSASTAVLPALLLATTWARWLLLLVARRPPARTGGMGAGFGAGLTTSIVATALIAPVITGGLAIYWGQDWRALIGILVAFLVCLSVLRMARVRLGGVTGDVYGLAVELCEVAILLVYAVQGAW